MSKLLNKKPYLAGDIKILYALSCRKIYGEGLKHYAPAYSNVCYKYLSFFSLYPFSNAYYGGEYKFMAMKKVIGHILKCKNKNY